MTYKFEIQTLFRPIIGLLFLLFSQSAFAEIQGADLSESFPEIFQSTLRPTPNEFFNHVGNPEAVTPLFNEFLSRQDGLLCQETRKYYSPERLNKIYQMTLNLAPQLIAKLEAAYPEGAYYFIGRDAMLLSDIIEVFYLSIGQKDRVFRLHVSTPTVDQMINDRTGVQFMESNGIGKGDRPVVFVDETGFSSQSQSRTLYNFALKALNKNGISSEEEIAKLLGVASTGTGKGYGERPWSFDSISEVPSLKREYSGQIPLSIYLPGSKATLTYFGFWHKKFSYKTSINSQGNQVGVPSYAYDNETQHVALISMFQGMKAALTPDFREAVAREAIDLGYQFHMEESLIDFGSTPTLPSTPQISVDRFVQVYTSRMVERLAASLLSEIILPQNIDQGTGQFSSNVRSLLPSLINRFDHQSEVENKLREIFDSMDLVDLLTEDSIYAELLKKMNYETIAAKVRDSEINTSRLIQFELLIQNLKTQPSHEKYFSENGVILYEWLKFSLTFLDQESRQKLISKVEPALKQALDQEKITAKDVRRLYLFMFSTVDATDVFGGTSIIGPEIARSPWLLQLLVDRAKVFLTSDRFDGGAKPVYQNLVQKGFIPVSDDFTKSCGELLAEGATTPEPKRRGGNLMSEAVERILRARQARKSQ